MITTDQLREILKEHGDELCRRIYSPPPLQNQMERQQESYTKNRRGVIIPIQPPSGIQIFESQALSTHGLTGVHAGELGFRITQDNDPEADVFFQAALQGRMAIGGWQNMAYSNAITQGNVYQAHFRDYVFDMMIRAPSPAQEIRVVMFARTPEQGEVDRRMSFRFICGLTAAAIV